MTGDGDVFNGNGESTFELADLDDFLAEVNVFDFPEAVKLVNY